MSDTALYRLMSWLSPAFPVGAYTHSGGLEWAVAENLVSGRVALEDWIADILDAGSGRSDAALFVHAYRASAACDVARLMAVADLAAALHPSRERRFEATAQGAAFRRIALATAPCAGLDMLAEVGDDELCYPIIVAVLAQSHGVSLAPSLTGYLHALVSNLASAAQRLIPLGQTDCQTAIAALEPAVARLVGWAMMLPDEDPFDALGSGTLMADFASLAHETQYTRLFRT
jgi:urease accessory protein